MPLRSDLLTKRWSIVELPILPFLAPRVFTPWPSFGRREHTATQPVQEHNAGEGIHNIDLPKADEKQDHRPRDEFLLLRLATKDRSRPKQRAKNKALVAPESWGNISNFNAESTKSLSVSKEPFSGPQHDLFYRKYEEIWGAGKMEPCQWPQTPPGKDFSKEESFPSMVNKVEAAPQELRTLHSQNPSSRHTRPSRLRKLEESQHSQSASVSLSSVKSVQRRERQEGRFASRGSSPRWKCSSLRLKTGREERITYSRSIPLWTAKHLFKVACPREDKKSGQQSRVMDTEAIQKPRLSHQEIKHVRWSPGQALGPFSFWQKCFAALSLHEERIPDRVNLVKRQLDPGVYESLIGAGTLVSLSKAWKALPAETREEIWPEIMLVALEEHPTKILKLLMATYIEPHPPGYAVSDSLDYIISYYLGSRTTQNSQNAMEILEAFEHIVRQGPPGHIELSQKSVYLLLKNLDCAFVGRLLQTLTEASHLLSKHTLMHFPSKLRLSGGSDERIDILERLRREGSDFNSPEGTSVCTTLLQKRNRSSETTYSDSQIFEFMLECGMKPNIIIYNVLLQNSLEAGDHETAWQIHDMMVKNGIETDAYTYSLLLTDAKLRNDRPSIRRIITTVHERKLQSAHIATDVLHTMYLWREYYELDPYWERQGRPAKAFERMLSVYRQHFHIEPLAHIIPWFGQKHPNDPSLQKAPASNEALMNPAVPTLVIMLTALLAERTESSSVVQFYNHFFNLVSAGDPTATALAKSTHVYNIILTALGKFRETLPLCPRLIGDILSQRTESIPERFPTTTGSQGSANQQRLHPKPDVYSWSILLKAFMDHGQPRAAEKVLTMMEDRKIWPNQITWNSLVIGYARMQDMSMTVDAVDRLKRSGFELDGVTMKGMAYFQNRRALIEAMRVSEARNPGHSRTKRSRAMGIAVTALNKTLGMVENGIEDDGLQSQVGVGEDGHLLVHPEEGEKIVVRATP